MLLFHIIAALVSIGFSTHLYVSPSRSKLRISYGLLGATVASGTYLVVVSHAAILSTCMMGLLYIGVVSAIILAARRKLAEETKVTH